MITLFVIKLYQEHFSSIQNICAKDTFTIQILITQSKNWAVIEHDNTTYYTCMYNVTYSINNSELQGTLLTIILLYILQVGYDNQWGH